jgi:uncharacterized protein (TIGR02001 family)
MQRERQCLVVLLLSMASASRADGLGGDLGVASNEVFRGLSQSDNQISPQADLHYTQARWYAGVSAVGVRRGSNYAVGAGLIAYLGYQQRFGEDWNGSVVLRHYDYPGFQFRSLYDYEELGVSFGWRERIVATVIASPDVYFADLRGNYGRGAAYTFELSSRQPLPYGFSANAGLGYYDLQHQIGTGYAYGSIGLGRQWRAVDFDLRYVGTNATAKRRFDGFADNRVILSMLWLF